MKKKLLAVVLCVMLGMTACGGNASNDKSDGGSEESRAANGEDQSRQPEANATGYASSTATIEEQVILDQDGIKITVSNWRWALSAVGNGCFWLDFLVENNSEHNLAIWTNEVVVNGYTIEAYGLLADEAPKGESTELTMLLSEDALIACGIEDIAEIGFNIYIEDNDVREELLETDMISIPTSLADTYVQDYDDSGELLYEDENVRIISKGFQKSDDIYGDHTSLDVLMLYIENNTEALISINPEDTSVNDFMVDAWLFHNIVPGTKAVFGLELWDLDQMGIESIETMETKFVVRNGEGRAEIAETPLITIQAQ